MRVCGHGTVKPAGHLDALSMVEVRRKLVGIGWVVVRSNPSLVGLPERDVDQLVTAVRQHGLQQIGADEAQLLAHDRRAPLPVHDELINVCLVHLKEIEERKRLARIGEVEVLFDCHALLLFSDLVEDGVIRTTKRMCEGDLLERAHRQVLVVRRQVAHELHAPMLNATQHQLPLYSSPSSGNAPIFSRAYW